MAEPTNKSEMRLCAIRVLSAMINGSLDVHAGCRELVALRNRGCEFIPIDFVGFDSELDLVPPPAVQPLWERSALDEAMKGFDAYRAVILSSVKELLGQLSSNTANTTGGQNEDEH
jgi:hypothetical protein